MSVSLDPRLWLAAGLLWACNGAPTLAPDPTANRPPASLARVAAPGPVAVKPAGTFSVSHNGRATFALEVPTPPGVGDAAPQLTLNYGGNTADGRLGVGNRLSGLSTIERCAAIPAIDGRRGAIAYDEGDRFCVDGQRLINVDGAYGSAGSVYRTELETWRLVTADAARCGSGPCSFTLVNRDGEVARYGATDDSRVLAVGRPEVRVWALSDFTDGNGNTIAFRYTARPAGTAVEADDGAYYWDRIDYASNAAGGLAARRSVRFAWQDRPDAIVQYAGGSPVTTRARLAAIRTYVDDTLVTDMRLDYGTSDATGRSLLASVTKCAGTDPGAMCLPALGLRWQGSGALTMARRPLIGDLPAGPSERLPADLDGDGRGDLVLVYDGGGTTTLQPLRSTGGAFQGCGATDLPRLDGSRVVPLATGQAGSGLAYLYPDGGALGVQMLAAGPDGCTLATGRDQTLRDVPAAFTDLWPMDFNGDGRTDLVLGYAAGAKRDLLLLAAGDDGFARVGDGTMPVIDGERIWPAEVNGDGMLDLVRLSSKPGGALTSATFLSTGAAFAPPVGQQLQSGSSNLEGLWPLDANGDGLTDLVQGWAEGGTLHLATLLADGAGRFVMQAPTDTGRGLANLVGFRPMDVVGDGRVDLVQAWNSGGAWKLLAYRNTGLGFDRGTDLGVTLAADDPDGLIAVDVNGDGRSDLAQVTDSGGVAITGYLMQGVAPDLADRVTNATGGTWTITYAPMSDPSVYQRAATPGAGLVPAMGYAFRAAPSQAPFQRVGGGVRPLVARVERSGSGGPGAPPATYAETHTYADALADLAGGRGWLGFATVTETDEGIGRRHIVTLNQPFPLTGTEAAARYACVGGQTSDPRCPKTGVTDLTGSATTYTPVVVAKGADGPKTPIYDVRKTAVRFDTWDYGIPDFTRSRTYEYDDYGNPALTADLGVVRRGGADEPDAADDVFTCATYDNTVERTRWQLGLRTAEKVSSTRDCGDVAKFRPGVDLRLSTWTYDAAGNALTDSRYDDTHDAFLTTRRRYDAFGQVVQQIAPGGAATDYTYDPKWQTYRATETSPPDAAGVRLTRRFGYDPGFGAQVAETDPNGNVALTCLDAFGRPSATQVTPPSDTIATDPGCVPAAVTGDTGGVFTGAKVVTIERRERTRDAAGRAYLEARRLQSWPTDANRSEMWFRRYVDGFGRDWLQSSQAEGGARVSCIEDDGGDHIVRQSVPQIASADPDCGAPATAALWTTQTYDAYGRPTRRTRPLGPKGEGSAVATMDYRPGMEVVLTDGAGSDQPYVKHFVYDYFAGQRSLVRMVVPADGDATTRYERDRLGRLVRLTDPATPSNPKGVTTTLVYDSLDRRTSLDDPDQNLGRVKGTVAVRYAYDAATGLLASSTDASDRTTAFDYDALGRMTARRLPDGTVIAFTYDGGDAAANGKGQVTRVEQRADGAVQYAYDYAYDTAGNRRRRVVTLPVASADPLTFDRTYDPQRRPVGLTVPGGLTLTSTWRLGDLAAVDGPAGRYASLDGYTASGAPTRIAYLNGAKATFDYAPTGEPWRQRLADASGATVIDRTLSWNALRLVDGVADAARYGGTDLSQRFTYAQKRLVRAEAAGLYGTRTYDYDAAGDLTGIDDLALGYSAHRVVTGSRGGQAALSVQYDNQGNMSSKKADGIAWDYRYDARDRLVAVERDGAPALAIGLYDDEGRRLHVRRADGTETFYPDPAWQLSRVPGSDDRRTTYARGAGGVIAAITEGGGADGGAGVPRAGTLYFHQDYLDSVGLTTDPAGKVASIVAYEPYGALVASATKGPDDFRFKFQGQELDPDSRLYYFGARYYDPSLGRFLTPDTQAGSHLTRQDALNRFAFATNNPVSYVDPTGHSIWDAIGGAIIGAAEIVAGVAIDVLSDGALEPVGGALIGAGTNGIVYSATHGSNFSWKQYGVQQGEGAVLGLVTGGFGAEADAGTAAASEAAEVGMAETTEAASASALSEASADVLESGADEAVAAPTAEGAGGGADSVGEGAGAAEDEAGAAECPASFLAGTPILAGALLEPIDGVEPGDPLLARSPLGGPPRAAVAGAPHARWVDALTLVRLERAPGEAEDLLTTDNHPFRVLLRGWVAAGDLLPGDHVEAADGGYAEVRLVDGLVLVEPAPVHNVEVAGLHTYFVGDGAYFVHNPLCRKHLQEVRDRFDGYAREDSRNLGQDGDTRKVSYWYNVHTGQTTYEISGRGGVPRGFQASDFTRWLGARVRQEERWAVDTCAEAHACFAAGEASGARFSDEYVVGTYSLRDGSLFEPCRNCSQWVYDQAYYVFRPGQTP